MLASVLDHIGPMTGQLWGQMTAAQKVEYLAAQGKSPYIQRLAKKNWEKCTPQERGDLLEDQLKAYLDREKIETKPQNQKKKGYEYRLSFTRAVCIPTRSNGGPMEFFQGSSLSRKKKPTDTNTDAAGLDKSQYNEAQNSAAFKIAQNAKNNYYKILARKKADKRKMLGGFKTLSYHSKQKIKNKIFALYNSAEVLKMQKQFTFLTLTFVEEPESHTQGKKLLNRYIDNLQKQYGKFPFIWVAECQPKNNNRLHFHLVCGRRFPVQKINSLWVVLQERAGIVNQESRLKMELDTGRKNFASLHKNGLFDTVSQYLNPVDIEPIKNINSLAGYVSGYVTKNESKIFGNIWHCCGEVSKLATGQIMTKAAFQKTFDPKINYREKYDTINGKKTNVRFIAVQPFQHQYGTICTILNKKYFRRYQKELIEFNKWIMQGFDLKGQNVPVTLVPKISAHEIQRFKYDLQNDLMPTDINIFSNK